MTTRRQFLGRGLGAGLAGIGLAGTGASHPASVAAGLAQAREQSDSVLVVIELHGGNDGLNTLIPSRQDPWYRLRPTLSQVARGSHALTPEWALHPALGRLADVYRAGQLAILHGVGTPVPERSHFHALKWWHLGAPPTPDFDRRQVREGWLGRAGRAAGSLAEGAPSALFSGDGESPLSLFADGRAPAAWGRGEFGAPQAPMGLLEAQAKEAMGSADRRLADARTAARQLVGRLERAASTALSAEWPAGTLASDLSRVARAIGQGLGARIYGATLGGFDTHLEQASPHQRLLAQLDAALFALRRELEFLGWWERCAILVYSEFGRRVAENQARGTDHGHGAPVLLLGGRVRGGLVGEAPDLERLEDGDVPAPWDLALVQALVLDQWLGAPPSVPLVQQPRLFG